MIHDLHRPAHATSLNLEQFAPRGLAVSPKGDYIAFVGGPSQSLYLCNSARAGQPPRRLADSLDRGFVHVAFSPDGRLLAAADGNWVFLWRMPAGHLLRRSRHDLQERCSWVGFSADSRMFLSAGARTSRLWDVPTGELRKSYSISSDGGSVNIAFCPSGGRIAYTTNVIGVPIGELRVLDVATGKLLWRAEAALAPDKGVAFSADGALLASLRRAGASREVVIRDAQTGEVKNVLATGGQGIIKGVTIGPDGNVFYWDESGNIKSHDVGTGRLIWQFAALDELRREL
jgi:WD40 repeat protein